MKSEATGSSPIIRWWTAFAASRRPRGIRPALARCSRRSPSSSRRTRPRGSPKEGDYLDGVFFEGVAYAFDKDTGMLLKEQDFRQQPPAPCREWFRSGALQAELDRPRPDGGWESETFYENGQTSTVEAEDIGWGLSPDGRLRSLRLDPDYPEDDLRRVPVRVDSRLYLASEGVTDEVVERLEDLSRLEYLRLDGTSVSARGLQRFSRCTNLKELVTEDNTALQDAEVQNLLARLPGCEWKRR